jgi:hypothetical protein
MRSVQMLCHDEVHLLAGMSLRYKLVGVMFGLLFGPAITVLGWHQDGLAHLHPYGWRVFAALGVNALGWFLLLRSAVFGRRIEVDTVGHTIRLIQRGLRPKAVVLPLKKFQDAVIEQVIRKRQEKWQDGLANRITCWILRAVGRNGRTRSLTETTDEVVLETIREALSAALAASASNSVGLGTGKTLSNEP